MLVVPECHERPAVASELGVSFAWKGRIRHSGLGVFGFGGWTLTPAAAPEDLPWILPLELHDPAGQPFALLLAVWTMQNSADRWPSYSGQITATIDCWAEVIRERPVILTGDTNCSPQGPSSAIHAANLERLEGLGMRSAYHVATGLAHGSEEHMTLRWIGPGRKPFLYHCDDVFLSAPLLECLSGAEVGAHADWIESGFSDHAPVLVELTTQG